MRLPIRPRPREASRPRKMYRAARASINRYGPTALKYARTAFNVASKVASVLNVEFKVKDIVQSVQPGQANGIIQLENGLTKGDDYNNRSGRSVKFVSWQSLLRCTIHPSATHTTVRCMLWIDKQANAVGPTNATELLDTTSAGLIDAFRNLSNRKRFVCLIDRRFTLSQDYPEKVLKLYRKLRMRTIYDDSDAGTIADIRTNALFWTFFSDEATNVPTITTNSRMRFVDN